MEAASQSCSTTHCFASGQRLHARKARSSAVAFPRQEPRGRLSASHQAHVSLQKRDEGSLGVAAWAGLQGVFGTSQQQMRRRLTCSAAAGEQQKVVDAEASDSEDVGEVEQILGSRVVDGVTQFLIKWKDDHPDSWEPEENISTGVVEDYVQPWWAAAKKGDDANVKELLEQGRDPDALDEKRRTALFFAAGFGHEKTVQVLLESGADALWQDEEGYTPLHMAAGYVHANIVKLLLDAGADPEIEDNQKRSPLSLAKDLLEKTPQNPLTLGRRISLDQVVKMLDEAVFEEVEVQQVLDRRIGEGGVIEYLVRWSDDSEDTWEPVDNIGEDLVKDYEEGVEYGVAEKILKKRDGPEGLEYLVKWADSEENTWEPADNIAPEVVAEFEGVPVDQAEGTLKSEKPAEMAA